MPHRYRVVSNHLSKRKPGNWWLVALAEVISYETPKEGSSAPAKRERVAKHHAVLAGCRFGRIVCELLLP